MKDFVGDAVLAAIGTVLFVAVALLLHHSGVLVP